MNRIALFHLEALSCTPAMRALFDAYGDQICFVALSDRFAKKHSGLWRQFWRNLSVSGFRFTIAYAVDLLTPTVMNRISHPLKAITAGRLHPQTLTQLAERRGIPVIRVSDVKDPHIVEAIKASSPTMILSMHFDQIFSDRFIGAVGVPIFNVHPGSIPDQRGPCPTFWALQQGRQEATVTIHRIIDATIDTGPSVAQTTCALAPGTSNAHMIRLLFHKAVALLEVALQPSAPPPGKAAAADAYLGFPSKASVDVFRSGGGRFWRFGEYLQLVTMTFR